MTRERTVGFMLGISVGTAIGFYFRQPDGNRQLTKLARAQENRGVHMNPSPGATSWRPRESPELSHALGTRLDG